MKTTAGYSHCVMVFEGSPKDVWRAAVSYVRRRGLGIGNWYRTANRTGFQKGSFRCIPMFAEQGSSPK